MRKMSRVSYSFPSNILFICCCAPDGLLYSQSCMEVLRLWGTSCIREMGCDTWCVIRAVLYAAMLDNRPILQSCGNLNDCCQVIAYRPS